MGSPNESKSYKDGAVLTTTTTDVEKDGDLMDQERTDQLRSRVAVDARGRLLDEEMEKHRKKGVRKIDFYAVPCLLLMWLANFIDRSNIGNARVAGLERNLGMHGLQYNICLAVFYVFYIVAEVPSNLVLKRVGANIWLPVLIMSWGTVTTLTGIVKDYGGLLAVRSILGLTEGGLLPGMTLYLSTLYPRGGLQKRIAYFYAGASVSGAFGGLLAYGLTHVTTAVPPLFKWSWIFIAEGIITVAIGAISLIFMPRSVQTTKLLTEPEREACLMAMHEYQERDTVGSAEFEKTISRGGGGGGEGKEEFMIPFDERFEWKEVIAGCIDIQVWLTGIAYLCICNSLYSFTLFLPTILAGLYPASDQAQIQLLSVPPYVPAAVMVIVVAYFGDRYRVRHPTILAFLPLAMAGYIMLIATTNNSVRYGGVFMIALGVYPSVPSLLCILPNSFSGRHYKKATAVALQLAIANAAGFVASFIYIADRFGPDYVVSHSVVLASLVLAWILLFANMMHCRRINRLRDAGLGGEAEAKWRQDVRDGKTQAPLGDRATSFRYIL